MKSSSLLFWVIPHSMLSTMASGASSKQSAKQQIDVWYCYKSGLGIEIARVVPLLSSLLGKYSVSYASFHAFLYNPSKLDLCELTEVGSCPPPNSDNPIPGVAFVCGGRLNGPFCDVEREKEARSRGFLIIGEDLGFPDLPVYQAAKKLALRVGGSCEGIAVDLLRRGTAHRRMVLNLFGGASLSKGLASATQVGRLVRAVTEFREDLRFIVPVLPHQEHLVPRNLSPDSAVQFVSYAYSDPRLTELVSGAPVVITVEGGMLHLAVAYGKPTACLMEPAWREKVRDLLPPASSFQAFELDFKTTDFAPLVDALGLAIGFSKKGEWAED